ncbi:MAG: hypothetical protein U0641_14365 [Anaerolineae bacterium]
MTVTLVLTPGMEARLSAGLAQRDVDMVRQILMEAIEPTVAALLTYEAEELSDEEFDRLSAELVEDVSGHLPSNWQGLSDYAVSREGIYEDHP